jgi:DNA replication licensing factor MCM2
MISSLRAMCSVNSSSLEVSYVHMGDQAPILAIWLADVPGDMLGIFDEVLSEVVLADFPHYKQVRREAPVLLSLA